MTTAPPTPQFYETKLATGRYYMARQLPATAMHLTRIQTGADTVMALDADQLLDAKVAEHRRQPRKDDQMPKRFRLTRRFPSP